MIFVTGHRASGKTTVGTILTNHNFWLFDSGPYWRSLRDQYYPWLDVDDFFQVIREQTGIEDWEDQHLAEHIKSLYVQGYASKKDLVISGYRSLLDAKKLTSLIEDEVFPQHPMSIWYIDAPFSIALQRYMDRDGDQASLDKLVRQYEYEQQKGLDDMRNAADVIINNTGNMEDLINQVHTILLNDTRYYPEGQIINLFEGRQDQPYRRSKER